MGFEDTSGKIGSAKEQELNPGYGKDVSIVLKFIRHGKRDEEGNLLDEGRDIITSKAQKEIDEGNFDAVKAIGSQDGPKSMVDEKEMGRALETADIYSDQADDKKFKTREEKILDPTGSMVLPLPFDYKKISSLYFPPNYDTLTGAEKNAEFKKVQQATLDHVLLKLEGEEIEEWKKERAGALAYLIEHYQGMTQRLKKDSKVLLPAGTHSPYLEILLQKALVKKQEDGQEVEVSAEEIGNAFMPAEGYNVNLKTDDMGELERIDVKFDDESRPQGELYLDPDKLTKLSNFYKELHNIKTAD